MKTAIDAALRHLLGQFPDVPPDVITSMFGDSYQVVVDTTGAPLVDKAEELTRLRLEVRTRHAAEAGTDVD
jgi:hypothetical protein